MGIIIKIDLFKLNRKIFQTRNLINNLINFKNLEPGDKLPSERMLSEKFEVSRSNVREAIQKLEFYGLLKSIPQSGTFVANIGVIALNGMIEDILRLEDPDFKSLVETRILLELKTARLAALRRTDEDIQNIKEALVFYLQHQGSYLYQELENITDSLLVALRQNFSNEQHSIVGGYARQMESLDFLEVLTTLSSEKLSTWLTDKKFDCKSQKDFLSSKGADQFEIRWYFSDANQFIFNEFKLNSSPSFWESIQALPNYAAAKLETTPFIEEQEIFQALDLGFIPAAQRELPSIINKVANKKSLPAPIQLSDIKGIIHSHSIWSDGIHSIEEMAKAAIAKGYEYLVISDHSKSAFYANGLSAERIIAQHKEIDALNKKLAPFVIFKSIESDILNDGSLDYPDEILDLFDIVIASVHSNLKMTEEKAMMRLLNAVANPYTSILGHPTGRLLLSRKGYPVDHSSLIEACSANNVVLELNAHPRRLDMDWRYIEEAVSKDVLMSIDPDAHEIDGFDDCKYGILVAQKAGLKASQNLSSFDLSEMMEFIAYQHEKRNS